MKKSLLKLNPACQEFLFTHKSFYLIVTKSDKFNSIKRYLLTFPFFCLFTDTYINEFPLDLQ